MRAIRTTSRDSSRAPNATGSKPARRDHSPVYQLCGVWAWRPSTARAPQSGRGSSVPTEAAWRVWPDSTAAAKQGTRSCGNTSERVRHRSSTGPRRTSHRASAQEWAQECRVAQVMSSQVSTPLPFGHQVGTSAAEHLSPSFPERAARGTADKLRAWQEEALEAYFENEPRDFLAAATPGAGKTTFALRLAAELLARRVDRPHHRRRADRAPQAAVGGCGAPGRHPSRSRLQEQPRQAGEALPRHRRHLRAGGDAGRPCTASSPRGRAPS